MRRVPERAANRRECAPRAPAPARFPRACCRDRNRSRALRRRSWAHGTAGYRGIAVMSELLLTIGNKNYSSWSLRPWILMKHLGLSFAERVIPLDTPEFARDIAAHEPDAARPGPASTAHLLIWDSLAICEYACELAGRGWPADARARAVARAVCAEMHAGFSHPALTMADECARATAGGPRRIRNASARNRAHRGTVGTSAARVSARPARGCSASTASPMRCTRRWCCACAPTARSCGVPAREYVATALADAPHARLARGRRRPKAGPSKRPKSARSNS